MEPFQPQDRYTITDLDTLHSMAEPLRMQIYEVLLAGSATVRQVAERLGLAPSRLYYHINALEKIGLVRVVETRMVANMMEKFYRAVAYRLQIADDLLNFETDEGKTAINQMLTGELDTTREDLLRSLHARTLALEQGAAPKPRSAIVNRVVARLTDERAEAFARRVKELIEEFEASDQTTQDQEHALQDFALMIAYYPSFYYKEPSENSPGASFPQ